MGKLRRRSEEAFASLGLVLLLGAIASMLLSSLSLRARHSLENEQSLQMISDRAEIKSALKSNAICPRDLPATCVAGDTLSIKARDGKELISRDGSKKIGSWNVRVQCTNKNGKNFWLFTSKVTDQGFALNPLTKNQIGWTEYQALSDLCEARTKDNTKILYNVCYGGLEGKSRLPSELALACKDCYFAKHYCNDNQITYPTCPEGYRAVFRHSDRFGWGGIDLTQYTECRKSSI